MPGSTAPTPAPAPVSRTRSLTTAALLTALLVASAWVVLPLGAVPVTLQVFFVTLAALLLPPRWAAAAMAGYVALGAAGLPVFAGGQGGPGVLTGMTGGYLFGFLVGAPFGALVRQGLARRGVSGATADMEAAVVVVLVVYALGAAQMSAFVGPAKALGLGVAPFVLPDAAKAAAAVIVARGVRRAVRS